MALTRPGVTRDCEPECPASALALVRVRVECVVTGHQPPSPGHIRSGVPGIRVIHLQPPPSTSSHLKPPPATSSHLQPPPAPSTLHTPLCRGKLQVVSARARHHLTITSHQSPAHSPHPPRQILHNFTPALLPPPPLIAPHLSPSVLRCPAGQPRERAGGSCASLHWKPIGAREFSTWSKASPKERCSVAPLGLPGVQLSELGRAGLGWERSRHPSVWRLPPVL